VSNYKKSFYVSSTLIVLLSLALGYSTYNNNQAVESHTNEKPSLLDLDKVNKEDFVNYTNSVINSNNAKQKEFIEYTNSILVASGIDPKDYVQVGYTIKPQRVWYKYYPKDKSVDLEKISIFLEHHPSVTFSHTGMEDEDKAIDDRGANILMIFRTNKI
jgi:hypothetical protein